MIGKPLLGRLLAGVLLLPTAIVLVLVAGKVLASMGDAGGAVLMNRVALGIGLFWAFSAIALIAALAVRQLGDDGNDR